MANSDVRSSEICRKQPAFTSSSFDQLVRRNLHGLWDRELQRFGSFGVDDHAWRHKICREKAMKCQHWINRYLNAVFPIDSNGLVPGSSPGRVDLA
jgi:hypothetical protein